MHGLTRLLFLDSRDVAPLITVVGGNRRQLRAAHICLLRLDFDTLRLNWNVLFRPLEGSLSGNFLVFSLYGIGLLRLGLLILRKPFLHNFELRVCLSLRWLALKPLQEFVSGCHGFAVCDQLRIESLLFRRHIRAVLLALSFL